MKSLFEELGGTYYREGDYLIPDLIAPEAPQIGIWGRRRRDYLLKNREPIYTGLLLSGNLNAHLEEIDQSASEMYELLIKQMAERDGVTEELKAQNQMQWVQRMNNIQYRAMEIINHELIYT